MLPAIVDGLFQLNNRETRAGRGLLT